jgi:(p)ppGpp synthase/HD superfamily hydrolase
MTPRRSIAEASQSFPKTLAALSYAQRLHAGQRRQADGAPFILHPLEVCCLLYRAEAPDHVIAAGVLHDTIEKTEATGADLREHFGSRVAALVLAVSEDQRITGYARRKAALREQVTRAGHDALLLLAADKISKVRELNLEMTQTRPQPARLSRLAHYRQCLQLLEEHLSESPLVTQLRTQLDKSSLTYTSTPLVPSATCL